MCGSTKGIVSLPREVIFNIVSYLELDDVFTLGQVCKELETVVRNESSSKYLIQVRSSSEMNVPWKLTNFGVQTQIPYSLEAQEADLGFSKGIGSYSRALRRCVKRRNALRTADPFSVAILGVCDSINYTKGLLCYILEDNVRILNLHKSTHDEIVVNIPILLRTAFPRVENHSRDDIRVLYCANDVVSCLYTSAGPQSSSWLISFSVNYNSSVYLVHELDSTENIFVRNDNCYIYYGTHSDYAPDGYRRWSIHCYDIQTETWKIRNKTLCNLVGSEVGSTVSFEIHDGFLYALSNSTEFDIEEIDWSSFYYCMRVSPALEPEGNLLNSGMDQAEGSQRRSMEVHAAIVESSTKVIEEFRIIWRRQHNEGPLDDRWTSLNLTVDRVTNKLNIQETRQEWRTGANRSQRTSYTTPINFSDVNYDDFHETGAQSKSIRSSLHQHSTLATSSSFTSRHGYRSRVSHDITMYPDDPLVRLIQECDNPQYVPPPDRYPSNVHSADIDPIEPAFTLAKTKVCTYNNSSSTFLDLVDDSVSTDWQSQQRLRLRVESRTRGPPLRRADQLLLTEDETDALDLDVALKSMYKSNTCFMWPNYEDPTYSLDDLDKLTRVLNLATHSRNNNTFADEYNIIYTAGTGNEPKVIVYIGFDPGVKLQGLNKLVAGGHSATEARTRADDIPNENFLDENLGPADTENNAKEQLVRTEKAMYRDINVGYYLGR